VIELLGRHRSLIEEDCPLFVEQSKEVNPVPKQDRSAFSKDDIANTCEYDWHESDSLFACIPVGLSAADSRRQVSRLGQRCSRRGWQVAKPSPGPWFISRDVRNPRKFVHHNLYMMYGQ
jgi:hypothetical protein